MKFFISGFLQQAVMALNADLDVTDLVLLRWFADFSHTGKMERRSRDGAEFFWVNYSYVLEQLPILKIGKKQLYRRFKKLVDAGVLIRMDDSGANQSCFAFGPAFESLICGPEAIEYPWTKMSIPHTEMSYSGAKMSKGVGQKCPTIDSIIKDNYTPPIVPPKGESAKKFLPPTVDEVRAYCAERKNGVDPEAFVDFYESKGWLIGKAKMKDWRAAVRTWERKDGRGQHKDNGLRFLP